LISASLSLAYVPVIHVLLSFSGDKDVDGRVKPGHDGERALDCFVARAPLRKRLAFVACNDNAGAHDKKLI